MTWVPWALAAVFAIAATIGWQKVSALREVNRLQDLSLADLRNRDQFSNVQIAELSAKVTTYERALAVVVFDSEQQRGLVKLDRFPKPSS